MSCSLHICANALSEWFGADMQEILEQIKANQVPLIIRLPGEEELLALFLSTSSIIIVAPDMQLFSRLHSNNYLALLFNFRVVKIPSGIPSPRPTTRYPGKTSGTG